MTEAVETTETESEYRYNLHSIVDILKSFREVTREQLASFPGSSTEVVEILEELSYLDKHTEEDEVAIYTLSEQGLEFWKTKQSYGNNLLQDYQFSDDEFKILLALSTYGPMTVAELVRAMFMDALRGGARLRHVEMVTFFQKEGSNSIFWTIDEALLEEVKAAVLARGDDDHYAKLAIEVTSKDSYNNFRSSYLGLDINEDDDSADQAKVTPGELFLFVVVHQLLPTDASENPHALAGEFIKKLLEDRTKDTNIMFCQVPERKFRMEHVVNWPAAMLLSTESREAPPKIVIVGQPGPLMLDIQETTGLQLTRAIETWMESYARRHTENESDSYQIDVIAASINGNSRVIDAVVYPDAYPEEYTGGETFNGAQRSSTLAALSINSQKAFNNADAIVLAQKVFDDAKILLTNPEAVKEK